MDLNTKCKRAEGNPELWVGDVINCRVYTTDRCGGYIHLHRAKVYYDTNLHAYCVETPEGNRFYLNEIVRETIDFVHKAQRFPESGTVQDLIVAIVDRLRSYHREPNDETIESMAETMVSEIGTLAMGYMPLEEIQAVFERER